MYHNRQRPDLLFVALTLDVTLAFFFLLAFTGHARGQAYGWLLGALVLVILTTLGTGDTDDGLGHRRLAILHRAISLRFRCG